MSQNHRIILLQLILVPCSMLLVLFCFCLVPPICCFARDKLMLGKNENRILFCEGENHFKYHLEIFYEGHTIRFVST